MPIVPPGAPPMMRYGIPPVGMGGQYGLPKLSKGRVGVWRGGMTIVAPHPLRRRLARTRFSLNQKYGTPVMGSPSRIVRSRLGGGEWMYGEAAITHRIRALP